MMILNAFLNHDFACNLSVHNYLKEVKYILFSYFLKYVSSKTENLFRNSCNMFFHY